MLLDQALTVLITGLAHPCIAGLVVAIYAANLYAILHAWRSDRLIWALALSVLFFSGVGGGIATAAYLILHHHEPLRVSSRRRAIA